MTSITAFIKKQFEAELLFTDTHSLTYEIIDEFVRLMSTMHSMKNIDGKESNTTKRVNIATEFDEFKNTLFNKRIIRHKMRRIQGKKHKMKT